jgi:uncharacterized MAPEG superfamily protein
VAASIALIGFGVDSIIESLSGLCLLESFPFFAVLVLVAHVTHHHSLLTLWGAHLYFWARLGYVLAAATGYGLLRSILFWNAALAGMVLFLVALLA